MLLGNPAFKIKGNCYINMLFLTFMHPNLIFNQNMFLFDSGGVRFVVGA